LDVVAYWVTLRGLKGFWFPCAGCIGGEDCRHPHRDQLVSVHLFSFGPCGRLGRVSGNNQAGMPAEQEGLVSRATRIVIAVGLFVVGLDVAALRAQNSGDIVVIGGEPRPAPKLRPGVEGPPQPRTTTPARLGGIQIVAAPEKKPVLNQGVAPIGAIMAWAKSMPDTPRMSGGWVECNGQELKDAGSPYNGEIIPNLNGVGGQPRRFLRGGAESGATGGTEDHHHGGSRSQKYGDSRKPVGEPGRAKHLPPYYEVVWIMRVK
jgi:hypothetical protein